jgi:hypothetical protein
MRLLLPTSDAEGLLSVGEVKLEFRQPVTGKCKLTLM